jgi:hypothetical protein
MIAKGNTHSNGAKLADYMEQSKDGERAETWQLRGFEATNIKDAFRDVEIMAGATKCEQPFFHVQVRNRDEGETLTRQQWEYAADRIERMLGLTGQPRAITFHTYEHNDDEHMHVAWSRIDEDTLTAKPLPFFKERLKKISRELELHFAFEPVTNERKGPIKYAPTKAQDEQARRLGVDVHELRNTIRDCWDRSDNGRSFQAALDHDGLILARGDRRGFVVIDQAGGITALGKRILDVSAANIPDRFSDLDTSLLPTVEEARSYLPGNMHDLKHELAKVNELIDRAEHEQGIQRLRDEVARVDQLLNGVKQKRQKSAPAWDRDRAESAWQDAVLNAAIEKEKIERQFVEPRNRGAGAGSREKEWPILPTVPEPIKTSAQYHFEDAARAAARPEPEPPLPENLRGTAAHIWTAWHQSDTAKAFAAAINEQGIDLAVVTKQEAARSHMDTEFAKAVGNYATRYLENEIVAISASAEVYKLNERTTGEGRVQVEKFLARLDRTNLQGIDATRQMMHDRAEQREAATQVFSLLNPVRSRAIDTQPTGRPGRATYSNDTVNLPPAALGNAAFRTVDKIYDVAATALESLLSPILSPEQIHDGEKAAHRREAEAEQRIDFSRYTAEMAQQRQQDDQEREAARRRNERER